MKKMIFCLVLVVTITSNGFSKSFGDSTCIYFSGNNYADLFRDSISGKGWLKPVIHKISNEIFYDKKSVVIKYSDGRTNVYIIDPTSYEYDEYPEEKWTVESWLGFDAHGVKMRFEISVYNKQLIQLRIGYRDSHILFEPKFHDNNRKLY